jgi:hypothetical protein
MGVSYVSYCDRYAMTKHEIAMELATLKLRYADGLVPLIGVFPVTKEDIEYREVVGKLIDGGYLYYSSEIVEDDERIPHKYNRGYRLTGKANRLLEEKAK